MMHRTEQNGHMAMHELEQSGGDGPRGFMAVEGVGELYCRRRCIAARAYTIA